MTCGSGPLVHRLPPTLRPRPLPVRRPLARSRAQHLVSAADASSSPETEASGKELTYRDNVGVCIINNRGLVFAGQRCDDITDTWQMPQGGIDEGEEPHAAALREVAEETSIRSARIVGQLDRWLTYDFPTQVRRSLHGGWQRFKGQRQKWYLAYFSGEDSEIDLDTEHREFKQWRWMKLEELPGSVVEFKREVYEEVAKDFVPLIEELRQSWQAGGEEAPAK